MVDISQVLRDIIEMKVVIVAVFEGDRTTIGEDFVGLYVWIALWNDANNQRYEHILSEIDHDVCDQY